MDGPSLHRITLRKPASGLALTVVPKDPHPIGSAKLQRYFSKSPRGLVPGAKVSLLVYETTPLGYNVIIDGAHRGLLYHDQAPRRLDIGTRCAGYIQRIRPDRLVDVSLRAQGFGAVAEAKPRILELLEAAGGYLPYNDDTAPAEIERVFGMSKKAFKRVIGNLYKERRISISSDGIRRVGP